MASLFCYYVIMYQYELYCKNSIVIQSFFSLLSFREQLFFTNKSHTQKITTFNRVQIETAAREPNVTPRPAVGNIHAVWRVRLGTGWAAQAHAVCLKQTYLLQLLRQRKNTASRKSKKRRAGMIALRKYASFQWTGSESRFDRQRRNLNKSEYLHSYTPLGNEL